MADEQQVLQDAKKLPLGEQLAHSSWKVRAQALTTIQEKVARAFSCEDEIFAESGPLLAKAVGDSNANVMDKAVETLVTFLEKADEALAARIAGPVSSVLASKCLKGKPATVSKTAEACMLLIELEQEAVVVESVLKAFADKVPKVVLAAVDIILQAVSCFGPKALDPKPIIKALPALFAHTQAGVRDKAKETSVELCAYLGQGVVGGVLLDKMPAAMRKDVDAAIAELPAGKKQPTRFTRKEAAARAAREAEAQPMDVDGAEGKGAAAGDAAAEEEPESDAYEFASPVDILGPLAKAQCLVDDDPPVAFWDALEAKKWGLRKSALDKVKELGKTPRLATGDYGDLVRILKKILQKDSIIAVAAAAADVAAVLATGLRENFSSHAKSLCPALLERFKEKNIVMSKSAEESLRTLAQYCFTLADVAEDVVAALGHNNPKVKRETAKFVKDVLENTPKPVVLKLRDSVLSACAKLADAGDGEVREAGQAALVAFAVRSGSMGVLDKVMDKLDDVRKKKIEEMVAEAIASKGGAGGAAPTAAARAPARTTSGLSAGSSSRPSTARSSPKALTPKNLNRPGVAAAAGGGAPKPSAAAPAARRAVGGSGPATRSRTAAAGGAAGGGGVEEDLSVGKLSNEELEERMVQLFGGDTVELLRSVKWQERVEAMGTVLTQVQEMGDPGPRCYELMQCVAFLPGWGDKNFQVLNKEFEVVTHLARCSAFGKRDGFVAMGGLVDKVHELKHRGPVFEALTAMSEAVGPQFVMAELHKRAAANKNPKVLAEALGWMAEAIPEFGLATMDVKAIIEWMKADLGSANAPVRNKAMEVLGKCHAQLGPSLTDFLEGLKPAQLMALEEHFRQNPKTQVVPTRKVRSKKKAAAAAADGGPAAAAGGAEAMDEDEEDEEGGDVNLDDLLPRTDISGSITPSLLGMISSSNWKERNAGVDQVAQLLVEASQRIQPNVGDLFPALKGRMADSNRNLAAKVLILLGDIAKAMGPPFDKGARPILAPAVANLSDNKKQVRDGVLCMLDAWIDVASADKLFPAVADAIANPKCIADGKIAGLQWLTKVVAEGKGARGEEAGLRAATVGIGDKASTVREAGTQLLNEMIAQLGQDAIVAAAGSLPNANKKAALEALTKVLGVPVGAAAASSAAAPAPSRPATAASSRAPPSRAGSRPGTAAARAPAPAPVVAAPPPEAAIILAYSDGKADRARKYRPRPGKFEGLNPEDVESLQRELSAVASPEFAALLFHKDFRRHLEAAERLLSSLGTVFDEVQASLDLILRWAVLRICDGNMQSLVKVLEMCKSLMEALIEVGYQMSEYEALVFLPAVVEKAGHNQDRVRALHRDVLRLACSLHPPQRVVDYLVQGLASKSNRTKIECCEEIAAIVEREGMSPVLASRSKPMAALAGLLKERDGATRSAALLAIEQAWVESGDAVWKLLGRLENRERDMVEEKLKRSNKQPKVAVPEATSSPMQRPSSAATRPGAFIPREPGMQGGTPRSAALLRGASNASSDADGSQHSGSFHLQHQYSGGSGSFAPASQYSDDGLQYAARPAVTPPNALATPLPARPATSYLPTAQAPAISSAPTPVPGRPFSAMEANGYPQQAAAAQQQQQHQQSLVDDAEFDARWEESMVGIQSGDVDEAVEHMKLACSDIMLCVQGAASPHMLAVMGQSADRLFSTVNDQLLRIFAAAERVAAAGGGQPPSRGAKYALNIMLQGMNVPQVAAGLTQGTLRESVSLLLLRLLDDKGLLHFEEGATLVKAVNVLMLKILEASNRTYAFAALLQLLRDPPPEVGPDLLLKFYDLVVKCLIKLTKGLQTNTEGVDLAGLLFNIHDFFLFLGVDEIRKRSSSDDKPLRMVKTILHELCKMLGYGIYQYTASIPGRDADPQPIIFAYISLNLQTLSQSGLIQPPAGAAAMANGGASAPGSVAPSPRIDGAAAVPAAAAATAAAPTGAAAVAAAGPSDVQLALAQAVMSEQQKAELKSRLKDIMSRLMQRDEGGAAMQELYFLRKEFPSFVDRYIATTSDMFKKYINQGLLELEREENGDGSAAVAAGTVAATAAAAPQELVASAAPGRRVVVPPLELQRPPLSPSDYRQPHSAGSGYGVPSPGGVGLSPSISARSSGGEGGSGLATARLSALRERMGQMRVSSGEGSGMPTPGRSAVAPADLSTMTSSLEGLQQRLASLHRRRSEQ